MVIIMPKIGFRKNFPEKSVDFTGKKVYSFVG